MDSRDAGWRLGWTSCQGTESALYLVRPAALLGKDL